MVIATHDLYDRPCIIGHSINHLLKIVKRFVFSFGEITSYVRRGDGECQRGRCLPQNQQGRSQGYEHVYAQR